MKSKNEQQIKLLRIVKEFLSILDLDAVMKKITAGAKEFLNAKGTTIYLLEKDNKTLTPYIAKDNPYEKENMSTSINMENSIIGQSVKLKKGLIFNDTKTNQIGFNVPGTLVEKDKRDIVTPLIFGGKVLGALHAYRAGKIFSTEDLSLAETFSIYASIALKNSLEYDKLHQVVKEQKKLNLLLTENEEKYRSLFNDAINMIYIADPDGYIVNVNKAQIEKLEYAKEELIGKYILDFISPKRYEKDKIFLEKSLENKNAVQKYETIVLTKSGKELFVELNAAPQIEKGKIKAWSGILTDITERKNAENKLKESEEQVRLLLDSTAEAIYGIDLKGKCTFANQACLDFLKYKSIEELIGKKIHSLIHHTYPDGSPYKHKECQIYKSFIRGEQININDEVLWRSDGTSFPVEYWSFPILREGQIIGSVVTFLDITERKRTQQLLREERDRAQMYLDLAGIIFLALDSKGNVTLINQKGRNILGYNQIEIINKNWFDNFIPSNVREEVKSIFKKIMDGDIEPVEYYENSVLTKNGDERIIAWHSTILRGDKSNIIGTLSSGEDITERKLAEENVRKLSLSVEQSPASVIITDLEGNIEYVNKKFLEVTGYSIDEVLGENPRILKSGKTSLSEYKKLWDTINSGKVWIGEFQNKKKNGDLFYESASISPIKNENGEITHFVGVKEDITERKILHEQLNQAQKLEAIGLLAGGIAHDFNNLLTIINGNAELALMDVEQESSIYEDICAILESGERASDLTRQLLAFSRKQPINPMVIDINEVIKNLEKMICRLIGEDIKIREELFPNLPKILADPGQLEQILMNLIINARDAVNQKTGPAFRKKIIIKTEKISIDELHCDKYPGLKPGTYIQITVKDNGIGIDDNTIKKIFDPFYTTNQAGKGTGLGLSTVYGIVKQNEGHIYVDSIPGSETTFKILWPVSKEKFIYDKQIKSSKDSITGTEAILIVEDNMGVRNLACNALKKMDYTIYEAETGTKAIKLVKDKNIKIDLLITDIVMPEMNGTELAERIKKIIPEIHVLYMSGYMDDPIIRKSLSDEKIYFINKPFTINKLAEKVRIILNK